MNRLTLALLLVPALAQAQGWQADSMGDPNALGLMVLVTGGLAFFYIRRAFAHSPEAGQGALVICAVLAVVMVAFPPARLLLAVLTIAFLVYGFFWT